MIQATGGSMSDEISQLKDEEKEKFIAIEKGDLDDTVTPNPATLHNNLVSDNKGWMAGVVLIAIGLVFLATNVAGFPLDNWWALFILIPAVSNFNSAYANYKQNGRLEKSGRGSITGGLILSLIAFTFLFNWDWSVIWPLFLIIGGIGALLGGWFE
jgi:hypothetical protein